MKKKLNLIFLGIVFFQILLLINLVAAQSYIISQNNYLENGVVKEKNYSTLKYVLKSIFSIKQIGSVSAEEITEYCCEETTSGALCQKIPSVGYESVCDEENVKKTSCEKYEPCSRGCCIDKKEGTCETNSPKNICLESENAGWEDDAQCLLKGCERGCCMIGDSPSFQTETWCKKQSDAFGLEEVDWRGEIQSEIECLAQAGGEDDGACVFAGDDIFTFATCRRMTKNSCIAEGGQHYKGYLCTHPELKEIGVECEQQASISCIDNEELSMIYPEIYWYDSCGNRENIYSADRAKSDGDGLIMTKEESCNYLDKNGNALSPTCGNCNYNLGSLCSTSGDAENKKVQDGDFVCRSLNCDKAPLILSQDSRKVAKTKDRRNGESWCIYEGSIGAVSTDKLDVDPDMETYWAKYCLETQLGYEPNKDACQAYQLGQLEAGGTSPAIGFEQQYYARYCLLDGCGVDAYQLGGELTSGFASDTVGSEHWLVSCNQGIVGVEMCGDGMRSGLCQEDFIEDDFGGFGQASCVPNLAAECMLYNSEPEMYKLCSENPHCMLKQTVVDKYFRFDVCVARYPAGQDPIPSLPATETEILGADTQADVCSAASTTCTGLKQKNEKGELKWVANEDCTHAEFTRQMNELCISMGDCGSYTNYIGTATRNIAVSNSGDDDGADPKKYEQYSKPVEGQKVTPLDISVLLSAMGKDIRDYESEEDMYNDIYTYYAGVPGALGIVSIGTAWITLVALKGASVTTILTGMQIAGGMWSFGCMAIGFALGAALGTFIAQQMGISGDGAMALTLSMGFGGIGAALIVLQVWGGGNMWNPVGWVTLLIAAAVSAYIIIFEVGKTKEVVVKFDCQPWQPIAGGQDCEKCNDNELIPCTRYKCHSLGSMCEIFNEDTDEPICQTVEYEDKAPVITPGEVYTEGYEFSHHEPSTEKTSVDITGDEDCLKEWTTLTFNLETDEIARCKYSFINPGSTFEDMEENYPLEQTRLIKNHTFVVESISLEALQAHEFDADSVGRMTGDVDMYVRCEDRQGDGTRPMGTGNFNVEPYIINFCMSEGPDSTPVDHAETIFEPESGSYVKYNDTSQNVKMWINEPAECKYSKSAGIPYSQMEFNMSCMTSLYAGEFNGWPCNFKMDNLNSGDNTIYIKCLDKPWPEYYEEKDRTVNGEDLVYNLKGSDGPLLISSTSPSGIVEVGYQPYPIELSVKTLGGALGDGVATCKYKYMNNWIDFIETEANSHSQPWTVIEGKSNFPILCVDEAENEVESNITFELDVDDDAPIVTRAYNEGSNLKIITDEPAQCYYDFDRCQFNTDDAEDMETGFVVKHSVEWNPAKTYHIKCIDEYGNKNFGCAIVVRPGFV